MASGVVVMVNGVEHRWDVTVRKDDLIKAAFPPATGRVMDVVWRTKDGRSGVVDDFLILEDGMVINVAATDNA